MRVEVRQQFQLCEERRFLRTAAWAAFPVTGDHFRHDGAETRVVAADGDDQGVNRPALGQPASPVDLGGGQFLDRPVGVSRPRYGPISPPRMVPPESARETNVTELCGSACSSRSAARAGPAQAERWPR